MFAAPFDISTSKTPLYQSGAGQTKVTLDDIVDALQAAKVSLAHNKAKEFAKESAVTNALPPVLDLNKNTAAYVVAEKLFATGRAYRPVAPVTFNLGDAKRDLKSNLRKISSTAIDPSSVKLEIIQLRVEGPLKEEEEDEEDSSSDDCELGRMPLGAELIDSRISEEEARKFQQSLKHFDDDLETPLDDSQNQGNTPAENDFDKWFQTPQRNRG